MNITTQLESRFVLKSVHIGKTELNAFLMSDYEDYSNEFWDAIERSNEYWDAFERDEDVRARGKDGLLDALDFDTVPFEQVEEELSVELFEQDAAEDREWEFHNSDDWDYDYEETWEERRAREAKARVRRNKIAKALATAMSMRPDLNWSNYVRAHNTGQLVL